MTGYTPYPRSQNDDRLPHITDKLTKQIHKTALGAESTVTWQHEDDVEAVIAELRQQGYWITALEQSSDSIPLPTLECPSKIVIILGREVEGVEPEVLAKCDVTVEIPMFGAKESFNVSQAAAMAMYHCRFNN
jgi:tRNA G18 (ribose-2'-O)-methylase SpoU